MVFATKRLIALAVLAGVALSGCDLSQKDPNYPASQAPTTFNASFNLANGALPWPNDLFFNGSTDLTLNIPSPLVNPPFTLMGAALNTQDGWSTTAYSSTSFNGSIDPATVNGSTVKVVELYLSNTNKAPAPAAELPPGVTSPVSRVLVAGTDYNASVGDDIDSYGKILRVTPILPFKASHGLVNMGYLVLVTNGVKDLKGNSAQPDAFYAAIQAAPATCSTFTDATQKGFCQFTKWQLQIAQAIGLNPANVVVSWSYTTQSVDDVLEAVTKLSTSQPIAVQATGLTTKQANAAFQGKANIYVGATRVPYFLTKSATPSDNAILTKFWTAAGPSPVPGLDPTSRNLTRFNPVPLKTTDVTIPLLVTVPNATAAGGACSKPPAGWPVVIVQHGITGNRTQALAIADSFADACFVVAAIDLPLHGLTDPTNPFYQKDNEPTFNVDLVNNTTGAPPADGKIDPSGQHFINLSSPLTGRDNTRQSESDLIVFTKSVANLDLNGDGVPDVDKTRISYVGLSLGAIVGGSHLHFTDDTRTATLSVPGGVVTKLLLDSPTFGPSIIAGVNAAGNASLPLAYNSTNFNNYFRDFQTIVDSGDPINHIFDAQAHLPVHLQKVIGDTVVPNSATDRLIAAGKLKKISAVGPTPVGPGTGGYTAFTAGSHGSLFDPTASLAATVEMQTQAVKFAASAVQPGGPFVVITNPAVIQQ